MRKFEEILEIEKSHFGAYDNQSPFRIDIKGIYNEFDQQSFLRRLQVEYLMLKEYC